MWYYSSTINNFLLIETADYLPDWLEPHTTNNRIWIKSGLLKIIVNDNSDRGDNELDLHDALFLLNNSSNDVDDENTACNEIQVCLQKRISKYKNEDTRQAKHRCIITLPFTIWKIIETIPDIMTLACKMYIARNKSNINTNTNTTTNANNRTIEIQQRYIPIGVDGTDHADGVRQLAMRSDIITLSRMQYARLKYEEQDIKENGVNVLNLWMWNYI